MELGYKGKHVYKSKSKIIMSKEQVDQKSAKTTQEFVPIQEIRDGIVILKDGSMRAIILASSLNFALKSVDEQNAIISQFQNLLNSLDFSIQIFVQSKRLDIRPYIALLEERYKEQVTELMKIQTREYIEFIKTFVDNSNIMTKGFFIVIPYTPPILNKGVNPLSLLKKTEGNKTLENEKFEEYRSQLEQRVGVVEQGLVRCGIRVAELGTEEVVELYYKIFNPGETEKPIQIT
jgi:type IV secretory pathway VirB4 component